MNSFRNKFIGASALVLLLFIILQQSNRLERMDFIMKTREAQAEIQNSQILDLMSDSREESSLAYARGFEEGRTQAGIMLANNESLAGYKEGYHAALTQFQQPMEANKSADSILAELLIDFMDHELSAEESYWELLEYMTEDPALKANTE